MRDYSILLAGLVGTALFYWRAVQFFEWNRLQSCGAVGKRPCMSPIELSGP